MNDRSRLDAARARADESRIALFDAIDDAKVRLNPDRVKADLRFDVEERFEDVAQKLRDFIHRHPLVIGGIVGLIVTILFAKPLAWLGHAVIDGAGAAKDKFDDWRRTRDTEQARDSGADQDQGA